MKPAIRLTGMKKFWKSFTCSRMIFAAKSSTDTQKKSIITE